MFLQFLQYLLESFIDLANTTGGQLQRTSGYPVWAVTFWGLALAGFARGWRFRWFYFASANHATIVLAYAALLALSIDISGRAFNATTSVTMGYIFATGLHGWLISKDPV